MLCSWWIFLYHMKEQLLCPAPHCYTMNSTVISVDVPLCVNDVCLPDSRRAGILKMWRSEVIHSSHAYYVTVIVIHGLRRLPGSDAPPEELAAPDVSWGLPQDCTTRGCDESLCLFLSLHLHPWPWPGCDGRVDKGHSDIRSSR